MKISRLTLRKIIEQEKKSLLNEGCGCGCKGAPGGCGGEMSDIEPLPGYEDSLESIEVEDAGIDHSTDEQFMEKSEALKAVVAIAMSTTCPITREALLSTVREIM